MEDFEAFADASTAKGAADATHGFICIAVDKTGKHISHDSNLAAPFRSLWSSSVVPQHSSCYILTTKS